MFTRKAEPRVCLGLVAIVIVVLGVFLFTLDDGRRWLPSRPNFVEEKGQQVGEAVSADEVSLLVPPEIDDLAGNSGAIGIEVEADVVRSRRVRPQRNPTRRAVERLDPSLCTGHDVTECLQLFDIAALSYCNPGCPTLPDQMRRQE
ncbi:hypothetical protein [Nocardia aurantiaca]|uniref:Uncharacterized protein n=1 Tax=Nocardia aurantiaca TaxID=2675850 RepID=A0A6I3L0D7_9NOCA|nr:hypothetical protein [Nocardia aurantiaca]MTE15337.1 hypothetical protein [Nocardia aurantiaca]